GGGREARVQSEQVAQLEEELDRLGVAALEQRLHVLARAVGQGHRRDLLGVAPAHLVDEPFDDLSVDHAHSRSRSGCWASLGSAGPPTAPLGSAFPSSTWSASQSMRASAAARLVARGT